MRWRIPVDFGGGLTTKATVVVAVRSCEVGRRWRSRQQESKTKSIYKTRQRGRRQERKEQNKTIYKKTVKGRREEAGGGLPHLRFFCGCGLQEWFAFKKLSFTVGWVKEEKGGSLQEQTSANGGGGWGGSAAENRKRKVNGCGGGSPREVNGTSKVRIDAGVTVSDSGSEVGRDSTVRLESRNDGVWARLSGKKEQVWP